MAVEIRGTYKIDNTKYMPKWWSKEVSVHGFNIPWIPTLGTENPKEVDILYLPSVVRHIRYWIAEAIGHSDPNSVILLHMQLWTNEGGEFIPYTR